MNWANLLAFAKMHDQAIVASIVIENETSADAPCAASASVNQGLRR